jgi:hypothetical protein
MLVDRGGPPLGALSPNRKRNEQWKLKSETRDDEFDYEVQCARSSISRCVRLGLL